MYYRYIICTNFILVSPFLSIFVYYIHIHDNIQMVPWCSNLQNIEETDLPYLVTLNPPHQPENVLLKWRTGHPVPSVAATKASLDLGNIQGTRGIWFCGAYQGIVQLKSKHHDFIARVHNHVVDRHLQVTFKSARCPYRFYFFTSGYGFHEDGLKVSFFSLFFKQKYVLLLLLYIDEVVE